MGDQTDLVGRNHIGESVVDDEALDGP